MRKTERKISQDATASTLACNDDGTDLGSSQLSASVTAGTAITAYWNNPWPHAIGPQCALPRPLLVHAR
jgi:hypothetical protein